MSMPPWRSDSRKLKGSNSTANPRPRNSVATSVESILAEEPVTYNLAASVSRTRRANRLQPSTTCTSSRKMKAPLSLCLLYTSDAADDLLCVDLGGRRIIKKKKKD